MLNHHLLSELTKGLQLLKEAQGPATISPMSGAPTGNRANVLGNLGRIGLQPPGTGQLPTFISTRDSTTSSPWTSGDGRNYPNGRQMPVRSMDDLMEARDMRMPDARMGAGPRTLDHNAPLLSADMSPFPIHSIPDWATTGPRAAMGYPVNPPLDFREIAGPAENGPSPGTRRNPTTVRPGQNRLYSMGELADMQHPVTDTDLQWLGRPFSVADTLKPFSYGVAPILNRGLGSMRRMLMLDRRGNPLSWLLNSTLGSTADRAPYLYSGYRPMLSNSGRSDVHASPFLEPLFSLGQLLDNSNIGSGLEGGDIRTRPYDDLGAYRDYINNSQ